MWDVITTAKNFCQGVSDPPLTYSMCSFSTKASSVQAHGLQLHTSHTNSQQSFISSVTDFTLQRKQQQQ